MPSRRADRRAKAGAPEWAAGAPLRQALSQRSGEVLREGDSSAAAVLESALRQRERVERATHGFHAYPAGLHPDGAAALLSLGAGDVFDPFCGGGTVLVEALIAGRSALGCDVSPVAALVARARTTRTMEADRTALRSLSRKAADAGRLAANRWVATRGHDPGVPADAVPDLAWEWYDPCVIAEIAAILAAIGNDPLARAVLSSVLVKVSRRESETANRKTDEERPPTTTATLFHKRAREFARQLEDLEARIAGVKPADPGSEPPAPPAAPGAGREDEPRARVHREDAREIRLKGEFGMVVTSPPYPGVYDYVPLQQLRLAWLGLDAAGAMREELGSRRSFRVDRAEAIAAWRADTAKWVRAASRALAPGGRMAVVIGDGVVAGRPVDSIGPLGEAARAEGLSRVARVTVERWDEGVERMRPEHAVLYEKAGA